MTRGCERFRRGRGDPRCRGGREPARGLRHYSRRSIRPYAYAHHHQPRTRGAPPKQPARGGAVTDATLTITDERAMATAMAASLTTAREGRDALRLRPGDDFETL